MAKKEAVITYYREALPNAAWNEQTGELEATCPWCKGEDKGRLLVDLDPSSVFFGLFRCTRHCSHGGYALEFAKRMKLDPARVPGYDPDRSPSYKPPAFPFTNKNGEMHRLERMCTEPMQAPFLQVGIATTVMNLMHVGYNGRLYVYPYLQEDGNCHSLRAVPFAGKFDQPLWQGEERFTQPPHNLFNTPDIARADGGAVIVTVGERNALAAKQAGLNVVAIPTYQDAACITPERLEFVDQVVIAMNNDPEGRDLALQIALGLGFKARIVRWPTERKRGFGLFELMAEAPESFDETIRRIVGESEPMSPLPSAKREFHFFTEQVDSHRGRELLGLKTCFDSLNRALDGLRGLNVLGAQPKAGKSTFFMQVASSLAEEERVPVIYYDFENGRQKVYTRILTRMSRLSERRILATDLTEEEQQRYEQTLSRFYTMLERFKVVTDRKISPDLMMRQIDFLRHQTGAEDILLVVDSLHKLPFGKVSERRTGIDAWLRTMEAIRDEQRITFLVISELGRAKQGGYDRAPDLASFKETGDIEYTADNALIMTMAADQGAVAGPTQVDAAHRLVDLWLVASREMSPGKVGRFRVDYPYWGFVETNQS